MVRLKGKAMKRHANIGLFTAPSYLGIRSLREALLPETGIIFRLLVRVSSFRQ